MAYARSVAVFMVLLFAACSEGAVEPEALDAAVRLDASVQDGAVQARAPRLDAHVPRDAAPPPACRDVALADCASDAALPQDLRCTGLYGDWNTRTLACGVRTYQPAFELWSDGAEKHRYVSLPAGAKIDATDPNAFIYPVGTQFWKEFRVGEEKRRGETRLLRKTSGGWEFTSYVWSEDGSTATRKDEGVADLFGTGHTVPTQQQCRECHAGRPDFVLGWDWLLLGDGAEGVTREALLADVTGHTPEHARATIPGDDVERAALGYLHVNCGVSCHNDSAGAIAREIAFHTRLELGELSSVHATDAARTGINRTPNWWSTLFVWGGAVGMLDFRPLDPARSYALARMSLRAAEKQMPRIGSNRVDDEGVRTVRTWIEHMTEQRGYPAPAP